MTARETVRKLVPAEARLRAAVARRHLRDWRARVRFADNRGEADAFPYCIADYERDFIDYPGQQHLGQAKRQNQRVLARALSGVVIGPGEVFSLWRLAGRPDARAGYAAAAALKNRQLTWEVGGAICLMSTTLYNTALLGAMEIVERRAHSVDSYGERRYFELGRDAAIEYGYIDLRFQNLHAYPVRLAVWVDEERVSVRLEATERPQFTVALCVSEPEYTGQPAGGLRGVKTQTTRIVRFTDGSERIDDLGWSVHHSVPG